MDRTNAEREASRTPAEARKARAARQYVTLRPFGARDASDKVLANADRTSQSETCVPSSPSVRERVPRAQGASTYSITPLVSVGIRNDRYKIVQNSFNAYVSEEQPCAETTETELYEINEAVPLPKLDREGTELPLDALTPEQQRNYDELAAQLDAIRAAVPDCPGDGNIDFVVAQRDLDDWRSYSESYGLSSV
jgi:hypothetical protein